MQLLFGKEYNNNNNIQNFEKAGVLSPAFLMIFLSITSIHPYQRRFFEAKKPVGDFQYSDYCG